MSRTPSPASEGQPSPISHFRQQSQYQTPDLTLHRHASFASTSSPLGISLDGIPLNDRNGSHTAVSTPALGAEANARDEDSLLHNHSMRSSKHIKHYEQMESWVGLVKAGTIKLLLTIILGGCLCLCLKAWEGFRGPVALSKYDVRIFNALTIAISICLGLNLLASLKRYAVILRWSILTMSWVSIEVFDLVLGIDELTNLLVLSVPTLRKRTWLTSTSRKWQRTKPGTNGWYAFVCSVWLLVNIGSQVLVASLSLFWPTEPYKCPLTKYGDVAVADLSNWVKSQDPNPLINNSTSLDAAWKFGMDAQSWDTYPVDSSFTDLSQLPGTPIFEGEDFWEYRFFYRNPSLLYSDYVPSNRRIQSKATCTKLNTDGTPSPSRYTNISGSYVLAKAPGQADYAPVRIHTYATGLITWTGLLPQTCGPRCTRLIVYQYKGGDNVKNSSLWDCMNIVSEVENLQSNSNVSLDLSDPRINGTDAFARAAAGAISWSGLRYPGWEEYRWRLYTFNTTWSPDKEVYTRTVQNMIMRYTVGAIAAFDDHGLRFNVHVNDEKCDERSQKLNVGWRYISSMLGAIGFIQLGALCYLLKSANRAIVRDASYFGTAMLLKPVIDVLKDEQGTMAMSGQDIKNHALLSGRKIRYGYKEGVRGQPRRITVAFEDEDRGQYHRRKWPSGDYS